MPVGACPPLGRCNCGPDWNVCLYYVQSRVRSDGQVAVRIQPKVGRPAPGDRRTHRARRGVVTADGNSCPGSCRAIPP
jgi:hypothetical protein